MLKPEQRNRQSQTTMHSIAISAHLNEFDEVIKKTLTTVQGQLIVLIHAHSIMLYSTLKTNRKQKTINKLV